MSTRKKYVALGYISALHGVKGWVKVYSFTQPIEAILGYSPWLLGEDRRPVEIVDGRKHGKGLVALLPGYDDRDQAAALVGQRLYLAREQLPPAGQGEYYWSDLEGLEVRTLEGIVLGTVERMMETGANDVLVIRGDREHLVPFVQGPYVKRVDLEAGLIEVDWDPDF